MSFAVDLTGFSMSSRYGLAFHTSSPRIGLALDNFRGDRKIEYRDLDRELSNYFHEYLTRFLEPLCWQDLDFIAASRGPGSFTSTRIGLVTARTLAQQFNIPLFPISSLAAHARSFAPDYPDTYIALQMPATRGQLYTAIYKNDRPFLPDSLMSPETWRDSLERSNIDYLLVDVPELSGDNVGHVLDLAYSRWLEDDRPHWSAALPFYG